MTATSTRTTRVMFSDDYLSWRRLRTAIESDGGDPAGLVLWLSKLLDGDRWTLLRNDDGELFTNFAEFVRDRGKGLGMEPADLLLLISVRGGCEASGRWDRSMFESVRDQVAQLLGVPGGVRERLLAAVTAPRASVPADGR